MATRMTSINRLLRIPEMLDEITQYFDRKALSRTARVCTAFHNASIPRLWSGLSIPTDSGQDLYDDGPLHGLQDLLPPNPQILINVRPTSENMWCRFKHYSVHLRAIQISEKTYWHILFSSTINHRAELFPQLRKLSVTWGAANKNPGLQWLSFVGPQLKSLRIHEEMRPSSVDQHLEAFNVICRLISKKIPDLEELLCDHVPFDNTKPIVSSEKTTSICGSVRSLKNLRSFSWQSSARLPAEILEALSELPQLSRLSLYPPNSPQTVPHGGMQFPALRRLTLFPGERELRRVPTRVVTESGPWLQELSNPQQLTHLSTLSPLPLPFLTHNLVVAELTMTGSRKYSDIAPLLTCKSIRICKISSNKVLDDFEDSSLSDMALSWRDLEELLVDAPCGKGITVLGLAPLMAYCPRLRRLRLAVSLDLERKYGSSWQQHYYRVLEGSYRSNSLEQLFLHMAPPRSNTELSDGGLGTMGLARLILRLWPSFNPDCSIDEEYGDTPPFVLVHAVMSGMRWRDREKEREIEELQEALNRTQADNEQIRSQMSKLRGGLS